MESVRIADLHNLIWILPILVGFVVVHFFKMMRMYLVVMEYKIPFGRFVLEYLSTTFANLAIPFKLGEIFRVLVFAKETKSFPIGLCSVVVDRFFDTLALLLVLFPIQLFVAGNITGTAFFLLAFLLIILLVFFCFPSTYAYLNRYIIMNRSSARSLAALRILEGMHNIYEYVRSLVRQRASLMFFFSLLAWGAEAFVLWGVAKLMDIDYNATSFSAYISSILSGADNVLKVVYTVLSAMLMLVATVVFGGIYFAVSHHAKRQK